MGDHAYSFSDQPTNEDVAVEVLGSHDSQEVSDCFHDNMLLQKVVQGLLDEEKHESSSLPLEICQAAPIYDEYNNEEVESYPSIINSDYYILEDLVSLDTKQNDQVSFGQIPMETSKGSPQLSDLQTKRNCTNHKEVDLLRSSIFEEQQKDNLSPYVPVSSYPN